MFGIFEISVIGTIKSGDAVESATRSDFHKRKVFIPFVVAHHHDFLRANVVDKDAQIHIDAGGYFA